MLHLWPYGTAFYILFASMKHGVSNARQVPIMAGGWPGFLLAAGHIIQRHPVELRCPPLWVFRLPGSCHLHRPHDADTLGHRVARCHSRFAWLRGVG